MEDSLKDKLNGLQDKVLTLRSNVPKTIIGFYEKHHAMLQERYKELDEEEVTAKRDKLRLYRSFIDECENLKVSYDYKEAIVKLNSRMDILSKIASFRTKNHHQDKNEDVRF